MTWLLPALLAYEGMAALLGLACRIDTWKGWLQVLSIGPIWAICALFSREP